MMRHLSRHRHALLLVGIVLLGLFLRLVNIGAEPYWGDEILSLDISRHFDTAAETVRYVREVEFHPPLYHLMLRAWTGLFGTAEAATRALSLMFGLGTIGLAYALGRRLFSPRAGLFAALIIAVLPIQVEFSQEARPYAMVCWAGAAAALCLWEHLRSRRPLFAVLYALATVFGLYLSYSYALIAIATSLWWAYEAATAPKAERWRGAMGFVAVHAGIFLAYYPWMDALLAKILLSEHLIFGLRRPDVPFRDADFFGVTIDQLLWLSKEEVVPTIVLFAQLAFKIALAAATATVAIALSKEGKLDERRRPALFLAWLALAPLVLFMFSPLSIPYAPLYIRHAIFASVPIAALIAAVASHLDAKRGAALVAVLLVTLVPPLADVIGNDWRTDSYHRVGEAGGYIDERYRPGDIVITSYSSGRSNLAHYLRPGIPVLAFVPLNLYTDDVWNSRATLGLVENETQVRAMQRGRIGTIGVATADEGLLVTPEAIRKKLDRIDATHAPTRIWLHGFSSGDVAVHEWFRERGWRHAFWSIGGIFALDLYVRSSEL